MIFKQKGKGWKNGQRTKTFYIVTTSSILSSILPEAKDLVKGRPRDGTGVGRGLCLQSTVRRGGSRARGDGQCQSRGKNENKQNHWTEDCSWWIWREVLVADGRENMLIKVSGGKDVDSLSQQSFRPSLSALKWRAQLCVNLNQFRRDNVLVAFNVILLCRGVGRGLGLWT